MVDDSFIREKEIDLGTELDPCLHYELRSTTFETKRSTTQRNATQRNVLNSAQRKQMQSNAMQFMQYNTQRIKPIFH
jgi:hypothetical protein